MKIISEITLDEDQIKTYRSKGYLIYYGYEKPVIKTGESVGFILDTLYKSTIETIENLLYRKTKSAITIKFNNQVYDNVTSYEWQHKYQENGKWHTVQHPVLTAYLDKRREYFEQQSIENAKRTLEPVLDYFHQVIPDDLEQFVTAFAPLYQIDVDYDSLESKLNAYASIKFYIDNDIEYCNEIRGESCGEFEVISYGDETYLEDMIYKNQETLDI